MESKTKISLEKIKEALKQADANIKFEEVKELSSNHYIQNKTKIFKRGDNYGRRTLG